MVEYVVSLNLCPSFQKILFDWILQELDGGLRHCKDEFKEFERQDVKYREDLKHLKEKIKKVVDKLAKVA